MDLSAPDSTEEWNYYADELENSRKELNLYVKNLHKKYPNGFSAYDCYSWFISKKSAENFLILPIKNIEYQSMAEFENLKKICDDLIISGKSITSKTKNTLYNFKPVVCTPSWEKEIIILSENLINKIKTFKEYFFLNCNLFGFTDINSSWKHFEVFVGLLTYLINIPNLPEDFLKASDWNEFKKNVGEWIEIGKRRDIAKTTLKNFDLTKLQKLNINLLKEKYIKIKNNFLKNLYTWLLLKPLRKIRLNVAEKLKNSDAENILNAALEYNYCQNILEDIEKTAVKMLGNCWNCGDWEYIKKIIEYGDYYRDCINFLSEGNNEKSDEIRNLISYYLMKADEELKEGKNTSNIISWMSYYWYELYNTFREFQKTTYFEKDNFFYEKNFISNIAELAQNIIQEKNNLRDWCNFQKYFQTADNAGLTPLLEKFQTNEIRIEHIKDIFENSYRYTLLDCILESSPALRDFYKDHHEKLITSFVETDDKYIVLTSNKIIMKLSESLPEARQKECDQNTELGILKRECAKKTRHKPIRKLLKEISHIIPKIKPCFLMSPLSVSQYLDVSNNFFDVVIFDEASQIPVWDAIGVIARGKQLIVVGDPKQLPPTNFFNRAEQENDSSDDEIMDMESVLDECLASGLKIHSLNWHYRSCHESLIAFSNHHYYENKLLTFPSTFDNAGVKFIHIQNGNYDKSKTRTNSAEADAIKNEVIRRILDSDLKKYSIGIITFNQAQQKLIEDKLEEARNENPEIDNYFNDDQLESLFVKNLENVQGDERDIILFSICYGPDQYGKISMFFGPLNRVGGERRLNVAITRAKKEVVVFSTLKSEHIDLSRTKSLGVRHLKEYLEYAEKGTKALPTYINYEKNNFNILNFEKTVAEFIENAGYKVEYQIGCSEYKIDLAVFDPDNPNKYILGIECDGKFYCNSSTARDRDKLRHLILEKLGWKIYRVWSTDWWQNSDKAEKELLKNIDDAIKNKSQSDSDKNNEEIEIVKKNNHKNNFMINHKKFYEQTLPPQTDINKIPMYPCIKLEKYFPKTDFYENESKSKIKNQILRVIKNESPITEKLLINRISEEWNLKISGDKIKNVILSCLPEKLNVTNINKIFGK